MLPSLTKVPVAVLSLPISAMIGLALLAMQRREFKWYREGLLSIAIIAVVGVGCVRSIQVLRSSPHAQAVAGTQIP